MFLDEDGSVSGRAGWRVVVDNPFLLTDRCEAGKRAAWNAWVCDERYVAVSVSTSQAVLDGVAFARDGGASHVALGTGSAPSTTFRAVLLPEREHALAFDAARPDAFRVVLHHGAGTWVELAVPFPGRVPRVSRYGQPLAPAATPGALASATASAHYYDAGTGTLHLRLAADGDYEALEVETGGPVPPETGSGTGLTGAYYAGRDLAGTPVVRTDPRVGFDWNHAAPAPGVAREDFSVRWTGLVEAPATGTYTFTTVTDDGVRLWVCGAQLVDDWTGHGPTPNSGQVAMTAGETCAVTMEYFQGRGGAVAELWWRFGAYDAHLVPRAQLYPAP